MTVRALFSHLFFCAQRRLLFILFICIGIWLSGCRPASDFSLPLHVNSFNGESPADAWNQSDSLFILNGFFNPGISTRTWWLRTTIQNPDYEQKEYYLVLNNPHINSMDVYLNGATVPAFRMGDQYPFYTRPYKDRDLVIPVLLAKNDSARVLIHLDKKGETLQVKAEALDEMTFGQRRGTDQMLMGFFTGWMAIVFLFALFFWWELRQISALLYALFTGMLLVWLHAHWGVAFQYWWPSGTWWVGKSRPLFNLVTNVLIILIILRLFTPRSSDRRISLSLYVLMGIQLAVILSTIAVSEYAISTEAKMTFLYFTIIVSLGISVLLLVYLLRQWIARVPYAGFFLLGIAFIFIWNILLQLDQGGVPVGFTHVMYNFGTTIGYVGQTALFTLGFAKRAARFKREKENMAMTLLQKEKEAAEALISIQEAERNRIGRDLHDSIGGMLGSIHMHTDMLSRQHPEVSFGKLKELTAQSMQEARTLSHNLAPPHLEEWGLQKVLESQVALINVNHRLKLDFFYETTVPMPHHITLMVYRICNELLANILKHSEATEGMLEILQEGTDLQILAEDNGKGMHPKNEQAGLGMKSIRERVEYLHGDLHIDSNNEGTTIIIQLPNVFTNEV